MYRDGRWSRNKEFHTFIDAELYSWNLSNVFESKQASLWILKIDLSSLEIIFDKYNLLMNIIMSPVSFSVLLILRALLLGLFAGTLQFRVVWRSSLAFSEDIGSSFTLQQSNRWISLILDDFSVSTASPMLSHFYFGRIRCLDSPELQHARKGPWVTMAF